ncbi:DUF3616 domain-containing protein [Sinorhizobium medicae]|uniref:DUF3616 domain-containing protein n=1 Tax=Sinorhizobium medicae TaxID=110321 RepID=UPI00036780CA|nr:DUF3616 domain-containing protein [Sinorhizobium medicae]MDX0537072.1 DUF3616 domain-containing protein [Sinorhizobium medicae]UFX06560.1 DUF3616 domain-containing protein [Sinorhizobium medicae WSM1115]
MRLFNIAALLVISYTGAHAEITRSPQTWSATTPFGKDADAREALSGAACVSGIDYCLAVNDEKKYAQFFDLHGSSLEPNDVIRLLPDTVRGVEMNEIDAEAAAFVPAAEPGAKAYFYVTGSHGRSRNGALRPSVFFVFRVAVDATSGRPSPEVERTALLRETIKSHPELAGRAEQPLDQNGATIEGLSVLGSDLLFGFRAPCQDANAYVMRVPSDELFKEAPPSAQVNKLPLGQDVGVRDSAAVKDGVLILAGRSQDDAAESNSACGERIGADPVRPLASVWFWDGQNSPRALGKLPGVGAEDKAETLLLLEESEAAYRALVMFDGAENGGPVEILIRK